MHRLSVTQRNRLTSSRGLPSAFAAYLLQNKCTMERNPSIWIYLYGHTRRCTDAPVHFFSSPALKSEVSEKGVFDDTCLYTNDAAPTGRTLAQAGSRSLNLQLGRWQYLGQGR